MSEPPESPRALPRLLSLLDGVAIVVGSMIGSGIFLKAGNVDAALMRFGIGPVLGVWLLVGLVTLCGALALAELAAMYPHAGGPYIYLREAYGRLPAFLWGWTEFWVMRSCSIGALACATALYFNQLVPLSHWGQGGLAIGIVSLLSAAGVASTRWSASIQITLTCVKLGFLGVLIVLPFVLGRADVTLLSPVWTPTASSGFWQGLGVALIAVMWPYDGWINLAPVAEDLREPQRNIPRALTWGMLTVITVYVLANVSYHVVLPMAEIAQTKTIAADVFQRLFGPWGASFAAVGVMCSTFGATNSNVICGPRIYLAMARDGLLPARLHHVHTAWDTPANAILAQGLWTVVLIVAFYAWKADPKAAFDGLTDSVIFAGLIFYGLTVAAVYILRRTRPRQARPYRTWGYPWTPALLIGVYAFALTRQLIDQWRQLSFVVALIVAGIVYYTVVTRRAASADTA